MKCWNEEPYDRPTFTELVEELDDMLSKMTDEVCFLKHKMLQWFEAKNPELVLRVESSTKPY